MGQSYKEVDASMQTEANLDSQTGRPGRSKFFGLLFDVNLKLSCYLVLKWVCGEPIAKGAYGHMHLALNAATV